MEWQCSRGDTIMQRERYRQTHVMLKVSVLDTSSSEKRSLFYKLQLICDDHCRRVEEEGLGSLPEGGGGGGRGPIM